MQLELRWWHGPSLSEESQATDAVVRELATAMPAEGITMPAPALSITDTQAD